MGVFHWVVLVYLAKTYEQVFWVSSFCVQSCLVGGEARLPLAAVSEVYKPKAWGWGLLLPSRKPASTPSSTINVCAWGIINIIVRWGLTSRMIGFSAVLILFWLMARIELFLFIQLLLLWDFLHLIDLWIRLDLEFPVVNSMQWQLLAHDCWQARVVCRLTNLVSFYFEITIGSSGFGLIIAHFDA